MFKLNHIAINMPTLTAMIIIFKYILFKIFLAEKLEYVQ